MLGRLFTKKVFFYELLEKHAEISLHAIRQLAKALNPMIDEKESIQRLSSIKDLEHEADALVRSGIEAIHRVFITPLDRDLIHDLLVRLDDITDSIDAAADLIQLYQIDTKDSFLRELIFLLEQAVEQVELGVRTLRSLGNGDAIKNMWEKVHAIEHETDAALGKAISALFNENNDPIFIIKYKEIYERLEEGTDRCNDAADILITILLEQA
jgi:predicted phosphate transport protein (TIGR00153 family)